MERLKTIRKNYINKLIEDNDINKAINISQKSYDEPIFEYRKIHPESFPILDDLNKNFLDICVDCVSLDEEIQFTATKYKELMENVNLRLSNINEKLLREEERLKDLNIICGSYNEFSQIIQLTNDKLSGNFNYYGNSAFSLPGTVNKIKCVVTDVLGNGYEGNKHVIDTNNDFVIDSVDTSNRNYMVDDNILTAYEYSRLTMNAKEIESPPEF